MSTQTSTCVNEMVLYNLSALYMVAVEKDQPATIPNAEPVRDDVIMIMMSSISIFPAIQCIMDVSGFCLRFIGSSGDAWIVSYPDPLTQGEMMCLGLAHTFVASVTLALFLGLPCLQYLITCSMQKRREKAWWILPHDPWHTWRHRFWTQRYIHIYISSYREAREWRHVASVRHVLPLEHNQQNRWRMVPLQAFQIQKRLLFHYVS